MLLTIIISSGKQHPSPRHTSDILKLLPDSIRTNQNVIAILDIQEEQSARKQVIEQRVRSCEEHLQTLRNELLQTDKNLQDVEGCVDILRSFLLQVPSPVQMPWDNESFSDRANILLSDSDSDSDPDSD